MFVSRCRGNCDAVRALGFALDVVCCSSCHSEQDEQEMEICAIEMAGGEYFGVCCAIKDADIDRAALQAALDKQDITVSMERGDIVVAQRIILRQLEVEYND